MAEKKEESEFKVSDRRLFTSDGELAHGRAGRNAEETTAGRTATAVGAGARCLRPKAAAATVGDRDMPPPPTAAEQQAQHDAYKQSSHDLDTQVELSGHSAKELEMTFERFHGFALHDRHDAARPDARSRAASRESTSSARGRPSTRSA